MEKRKGYEKLWTWFSLSRASFLVMPRVMMHEMPDDWQNKLNDLLEEWDSQWDTSSVCDHTTVSLKRNNKFIKIPKWLTDYRRPDKEKLNSLKCN